MPGRAAVNCTEAEEKGHRFPPLRAAAPFDHEKDYADMRKLIAGCDDALESLMQRHSSRLASLLGRVLKNSTEARECVEEAFVRVYFHRQVFHLGAKFSTWLYTIAFNLARDRLRRRARRPEFVSWEAPEVEEAGDLKELLDPSKPPDQVLENREWDQELAQAVERLPECLRRAWVLYAEEGRSQPEIAAEFHCTSKAIEMRLYHARKLLNSRLKRPSNKVWEVHMAGVTAA